MPEPPATGLFTRYVWENPYPLAIVLIVLSFALIWTSLHNGKLKRILPALGLGALGLGVMLGGFLVVTAGEHAQEITRKFVDAVVAEDSNTAIKLLAADASLAFDSPQNPGHDLGFLKTQISRVFDQYSISSNSITRLEGYTKSNLTGECHVTCWTYAEGGLGPVKSQWVVQVTRQGDGSWEISRLTCVTINDQLASRYR